MSEQKDGGPAFPVAYEHSEATCEQHGMTLRDYFAAKAMAAFMTGAANMGDLDRAEIKRQFRLVCDFAYLAADEMLAARSA